MDIHPKISLTSRLSLRDFDTELWHLYFSFLKGLLLAASSILYLVVLVLFFAVQNGAFAARQFAVWVTDWNPEKPQAFEIRPVDAD
jgi:hypothetical protein